MKAHTTSAFAASLLVATSAASGAYAQTVENRKVVAMDAAPSALFGYATAVHGTRGVVGARGEATNGNTSGAAYVFDTASGQQLLKLLPLDGDPGDIFGNTVAINDSVVLVGADREDGNEDGMTFLTNSGSAYLFDATTGQQLFKLRASDPLSSAHFAESVALSGNLAAIGSNARDAQLTETGAVYIFDVTTGAELHKLLPADSPLEGRVGEAVGISGSLAVAGALGDDTNGTDAGAAYVFDAITGAQVVKLLPSDGAERDTFGEDVAISGNRVVVGAMRDDDLGENSGSAYVFDALTGQQLMKLLPDDGATFDNFGGDVAINQTLVFVSASRHDQSGNDSGAVYVFDLATGQQLSKLLSSDGSIQHFFGYGLAISEDTAVIGSPFSSDAGTSSGSAYVFEFEPGGVTSYCAPTSASSVFATGALLTSAGGFGTSQATFHLTNVPDSFGILFTGSATADVVLGCGTRCVGGSLIRGMVLTPAGNQLFDAPFDMSQPGATHIQYWYRDSGTCGSGTNLSNALTR